MEALQTLEVRRVAISPDLEKPGDYCFIARRETIRTFETIEQPAPKGFFRRLVWLIFGSKQQHKETMLPQWPDYDAIVMGCPHCGQPIGTTKEHRILSVEPLTIDKPLACAYSCPTVKGSLPTVAFQVKDGKLMPA